MEFITVSSLGFEIFSDELSKIVFDENCKICNTISPNSYGLSTKETYFKEALQNSDYLVLDGVYYALASILLSGKNIKRNQGPDVFYHFMARLEEQKGKVFFLGSTEHTLSLIENRVKIEYPNIMVESYSPPFSPIFTNEENNAIIEKINSFQPDILFIGMTCPKQEKWSYNNKLKVKANLVCSIGAVFDWYAGKQPEISQFWWKLRLGWVKRIIDRPELMKRNFPNALIFLKHLFLTFIGIKQY